MFRYPQPRMTGAWAQLAWRRRIAAVLCCRAWGVDRIPPHLGDIGRNALGLDQEGPYA